MNTLSSGANGLPPAAEVEAFVYQDIEGNALSPESATPAELRPKERAAARDNVPRISEEELSRMLSEARAEGVREGERRSQAGLEEELARGQTRIAEVLSAFQQERNEYYSKVEIELVHFALAIATKILHREAQVDRMVVAGLAKVMLEKVQSGTKTVVRVRPEATESWRHYFRDNSTVQIVEDFSLGPKDCVVETELGTAELGLDAQLKEIEKGFFDLLAQKPEAK
jgi:flagellar assembly protein FliH